MSTSLNSESDAPNPEEKEYTLLNNNTFNNCQRIRCNECNLPFLTTEQLDKHVSIHTRKKSHQCKHCRKSFTRAARLTQHIQSCDKNPNRKAISKSQIQVGMGTNEAFQLVESALRGTIQVWRHNFSSQEQLDIYGSLNSIIMKNARDLVNEATGLFKWYLVLKIVFYKMGQPHKTTDPPVFFQTVPVASFRNYSDDAWDIAKEQLEKQIENYEKNGSGWVVQSLISLDVTFAKMANPLA